MASPFETLLANLPTEQAVARSGADFAVSLHDLTLDPRGERSWS